VPEDEQDGPDQLTQQILEGAPEEFKHAEIVEKTDPPVDFADVQKYMLPETEDGFALTPKYEWLQTAIRDLLTPDRNELVYRIEEDG
jgi:hypothetical protein